MVTTTSAARTTSSVSGFGKASARSKRHETGGDLAAAGVLDADEEDLGLLLGQKPFHLTECLQSLAGEAVGQHRHVDVDLRIAEQVHRLGDVARDRLARKRSGELILESLGSFLDVLPGDRIEHLGHCYLPRRVASDTS